MNDVELMAMAAKAVGIADLRCTETMIKTGRCYYPNDSEASDMVTRWNPLTDDGDALRLAVKLMLDVLFGDSYCFEDVPMTFCGLRWDCGESKWSKRFVKHGEDPMAATRRAIVRAAAEIGKAMK